jgi:hypothetical protein
MHISACSVSRPVRDALAVPADGRVAAVFDRSCIMQIGRDRLVALVAPELDNGPLNIVLERAPAEWLDLQPGMPVRIERNGLQIDRLKVSLDCAAIWEPRPDWERLRANGGALLGRLGLLATRMTDLAPGDSLLALVHRPSPADGSTAGILRARVLAAAEAMWAGWRGDEAQLSAGAAELAGLGGGLTPAGDDWLLGAMLCAWLAHPDPSRYCEVVLEACSSRTTLLSAAFLRSAAAGECSAPWHRLLAALARRPDEQLGCAVREVIAWGHTSGADALAGLVWMGQRAL